MSVLLINVGYGNFISADKVIAVVDADSAPTKRAISEAREKGFLVDATLGHKTRSVVVMESGHLVLSAKSTETVAANFASSSGEGRRTRGENAHASAKGIQDAS